MVLHIKELFLEILNNYHYDWNDNRVNFNFYQYIPTIVNFNQISKVHYEWCKECYCFNSGMMVEIKNSLIWLNVQILRKTINNKFSLDRHYIKDWTNDHVCKQAVEYAVLLYNNLNQQKIIGNYPKYNICAPYIYPNSEYVLQLGSPRKMYKNVYKNFPEPKEIIYCKLRKKILYTTGKCLTKDDLELLQYKPYFFKWVNKDRPITV